MVHVTPREAVKTKGFEVDAHAAGGWVAYKGPRFNPTKWFDIMSDQEFCLYLAAKRALAADPNGFCPEIIEAVCRADRMQATLTEHLCQPS